jgi:hypothetical protein
VLNKEIRDTAGNEEMLIQNCKDKLQPILTEITENHKSNFRLPSWTPGGIFTLGNVIHPSKLASAVQAALDKTSAPSSSIKNP